MERKLLITAVLTLFISAILVIGCREEEDNDLITGKWRMKSVIESVFSTPCDLQSYLEFNEYVFQSDLRKAYDVKVSLQSMQIVDGKTVYTCKSPVTTTYNYKIGHDTLTMVNASTQGTKQYIIEKIDGQEMVLKSLTLDIRDTLIRWQQD